MATLGVDLGLGGSFRQTLVNEPHVVSAWALSQVRTAVCRDLAFGQNPLTYTQASGCTRGVSSDLPEGALGCTFDGTGYLEAPADGEGYARPGDALRRSLSLTGGSFNVVVHLATTTHDTTLRAVAQKQATNSSGIGWHVALQNGAIVFTLKTSAGTVFSFARGGVDDGAEHVIHCYYDPLTTQEARIYIDGTLSGTAVTGVTTEPVQTSGAFRIGAFNDGAGRLTGDETLFHVMVGREGNPDLSVVLEATRRWTDRTSHVRASGALQLRGGIAGTTFLDRMADAGTGQFHLDNGLTQTIEGLYSLGHAHQQAGFALGIPIRVRLTSGGTTHVYRYTLAAADPETGTFRAKRVRCLAEDWIALAERSAYRDVAPEVNARSDQVWGALVDAADRPPVAVTTVAGAETFPFALDREADRGMIAGGLHRVVGNEFGYGYLNPDTTRGGVLTFEPRHTRQLATTPMATFDETMVELGTRVSVDDLINAADVRVTPRAPGASNTDVLWASSEDPAAHRMAIGPRETITLTGSWRDPDQSRSSVGGTDFQEPLVAGTDYTFTANPDGTGASRVGQLTVRASLTAAGCQALVTNAHETLGGYLYLQVRGRVLRTDQPQTARVEDGDSVRARGARPTTLHFEYLNSLATALNLAQLPLALFKDGTLVPTSVTFRPAPESTLEQTVLGLRVGHLIAINESVSGITTSRTFWVQSYDLTVRAPGQIEATVGLFPSFADGDVPFGVWDDTNWDACRWGL